MKPWGVIHNGCCGLKRFKSEPEEILTWMSSHNTNDIYQRVEILEKFKDFLSSNVVEISKRREGRSKHNNNKNNDSSNDSINNDSSNNSINNDSISIV